MAFNVALQVFSPPMQEVKTDAYLVSRPPSSLAGVPKNKQVIAFIVEWSQTDVEEQRKVPGWETYKAEPKWARDTILVNKMLNSINDPEDGMKKLKVLATVFWTDPKFSELTKSIPMMWACWDSIRELIVKKTREAMD